MTSAAGWRGRIIFTNSHARYVGSTGDNRLHSHIAAQVVIGPNSTVELADGERVCGPALAIRPHVRHRLLPMASATVYLIEPTSRLGAAWLAQLPAGSALVIPDAEARLDRLLGEACAEPVDRRLQQAMSQLARADSFEQGLDEVARAVGLSPVRLRAIASRELGMPLARWRRWSAIRRACVAMVEGQAPAEAAHLAGFSDQAHLTRAMRAMLGITPTAIARA
jgi:AraC-like DNA-binding protein